jgi:hypothetical protein
VWIYGLVSFQLIMRRPLSSARNFFLSFRFRSAVLCLIAAGRNCALDLMYAARILRFMLRQARHAAALAVSCFPQPLRRLFFICRPSSSISFSSHFSFAICISTSSSSPSCHPPRQQQIEDLNSAQPDHCRRIGLRRHARDCHNSR